MRILITGGSGFIGSHLCEKYAKEGCTVICLDNFMNGNLVNIRPLLAYRNFKLVNGDVRDFNLLEKIMHNVDVVFHLAAQIHVDKSIVEPKMTYEINVLGTLNVLEAAKRHDVKRVIHTSTSEVYGSAQYTPIDEKHPLDAPHPYGASKIAADRTCHAYMQTYNMDITILRPFNTFGMRQKDKGYGGAISLFVRRVLDGSSPIIYGDGEQTRDYVYISDLIEAYDLVLDHPKPLDEPLNIATGKEVRIIDLANKIIELCGKKGEIAPVKVEPRPGEVRRLIGDSSRARTLLEWKPKYTLEEGLRAFIKWHKNHGFEEWEKPG